MSEIVVETTPSEVVIEIEGGPTLTTTVEQELQTVVEVPSDPVVIDLNSGARGEPGSAVLSGPAYPTLSMGSVGDVYVVTDGDIAIGNVYTKGVLGWIQSGNIRGPVGGINNINGYGGPNVTLMPIDLGLERVNNTNDAEKPVSVAAQAALDALEDSTSTALDNLQNVIVVELTEEIETKQDFIIAGTNSQYWRGDKTWQTLDKAAAGLGNVDNTSDANKPVSTAAQTALNLKAPIASPTFTGTVGGISKAMVGLGNVDNTADSAKPVSTIQQTALDGKANRLGPQTWGGTKTFSSSPVVPDPTDPTHAANKSYVDNKFTSVIDAAPAALDTLNELAAALGDDPNFATTVTSQIATKEPVINAGTTGQYWRGDKSWQTLNKSAVGLGNVDNTTDLLKPISTATQSALDGKAPIVHGHVLTDANITGVLPFAQVPTGTTATTVALGNHIHDDRYFTETESDDRFTRKATMASVASATWFRIATINGGSTSGGASISLMVGGTGIYSQASRATDIIHFGQRGDNVYSFEAWRFGTNTAPWQYFVKQISTWVFELWARRTGFDSLPNVIVTGSHNATLNLDSATTTDPALTSAGTPISVSTLLSSSVIRVVHNGTSYPARPTSATYVEWVGPTAPAAATSNDTWVNTAL